ncbi:hypothetical protein [Tsukamurella sp. NPDC003166]|uniref:hypothetical protein n=1 Tax=Tsukamurella sp. NPDC003166 TaxID=3154444 RepID=UPI0033B1FDB1
MSKLFLSCDLTGSTAFKQRPRSSGDTPWQKVFLQFYREFPQRLYAQQRQLDADNLQFDLWKAVGDELIFTCDVQSETDICVAVDVWIATLRAYKASNLQAEDRSGLGVKGGIFLGTFPGPDSESTIPLKPGTESSGMDVVTLNSLALTAGDRDTSLYLFDYFGPSIDTGFRVTSKCTARYLTLSVEVAYALALMHPVPHSDGKYCYPDLKLMDSIELKGVWGGRDYPVFAIDLDHDDAVHLAMSKFLPTTASPEDVQKLCEACYTSDGWPFLMYLPDSALGRFAIPPVDPLEGLTERAPDPLSGGETVPDEASDTVKYVPSQVPTRPVDGSGRTDERRTVRMLTSPSTALQ